jgi:hypothetical protein
MSTFIDPATFPLPDHWSPEQALAVHEVLDMLLALVWLHYGAQLQQAFADDESIDTDSPQLDLFDLDDPLPF